MVTRYLNHLVEDGLMTVAEATEFLRVSRAYLYQLMQSGQLPYSKLGRNRRIPRRAVVAFAARSIHSGEPGP